MIIAWIYLAAECGNTLNRGRKVGRSTISTTEIDLFLKIYLFSEMGHKVKYTPRSGVE